MGNREALLEGAKQCLVEKGFAATTARDIAAASGTSLAAIGYHYRSTDALMSAALIAAIDDWGEELERALGGVAPDLPVSDRFEAVWARVIESLTADRRLMAASVEALGQIDRVEAIREYVADGLQQGRSGLAAMFLGVAEDSVDASLVRTAGSVYQALMTGVIVQWLVDPDHAPSARDLADGLEIIAAHAGA